jgi:putative DNA primase/helicase
VGFVFCADDPYCGIDLDDCIAADGSIARWAKVRVDHLASYTERSQSGKGLHLIARAALAAGGNRRGQVEMYDTGRFFIMTGDALPGRAQIHDRQPEIDTMHRSIFDAPPPSAPPATPGRLGARAAGGTSRARFEAPPRAASGEHARAAESPGRKLVEDAALIARAAGARDGDKFAALWRGDATGYASASEADMALVSRLAFWTAGDAAVVDRLFRQSGLFRPKWDQRCRRDGATYGQVTIDKALRSITEFYRPEHGRGQPGSPPHPPQSTAAVSGSPGAPATAASLPPKPPPWPPQDFNPTPRPAGAEGMDGARPGSSRPVAACCRSEGSIPSTPPEWRVRRARPRCATIGPNEERSR